MSVSPPPPEEVSERLRPRGFDQVTLRQIPRAPGADSNLGASATRSFAAEGQGCHCAGIVMVGSFCSPPESASVNRKRIEVKVRLDFQSALSIQNQAPS
jgi:hypothetical protein